MVLVDNLSFFCFLSVVEALIFPKNLRKLIRSSLLPNVKHLKVKTCCELQRESDLEKALRWLSPSLETLSIEQKKKRQFN